MNTFQILSNILELFPPLNEMLPKRPSLLAFAYSFFFFDRLAEPETSRTYILKECKILQMHDKLLIINSYLNLTDDIPLIFRYLNKF